MSAVVVLATWRRLLAQPVRVGALLGVLTLPLLPALFDPQPPLVDPNYAVVLGALATVGVIGLEVSSGALGLTLTRPLARRTWVVSRWLAVASAAAALAAAQVLGHGALILARTGTMPAEGLAIGTAEAVLAAAGVSTVLVLLSSLGASYADLVIWLSALIASWSAEAAGEVASLPSLVQAGQVLRRLVCPRIDLHRLLFSTRVPYAELLVYAATTVTALALAVVMLNRRELSYADD